jgi:DNA-binding transcriptional LysR family regulator
MPFKRGQLHYFVTVAEEGQMTRAARRLHLAQPALSQAIAQLEAELGIELLHRHPRGVTLTAAGEVFLAKARVALAADLDATATAESLARAATGTIEIGFIGPPPTIVAPKLLSSFVDAHPDVGVSYKEMPFPFGPTSSWLSEVDVAMSHRPEFDKQVGHQPVKYDRRVAVLPEAHPLADRDRLAVADILDDTFVGYHASVQAEWAAFHSLDDHRGGPPRQLTTDRALTPAEMMMMLASRRAVATLPATDANVAREVLRGIVVVPLSDAEPFEVTLTWRKDNHNPLVQALVALAANLACEQLDEPAPRPTDSEVAETIEGLNSMLSDRGRVERAGDPAE